MSIADSEHWLTRLHKRSGLFTSGGAARSLADLVNH